MSRATIPDWPRLMKRATAAAYLDMKSDELEREVTAGRLPLPLKVGAEERWSRITLDQWLDRLTGDSVPDWRSKSKLYGNG
jgi:hypothetical protein